MEVGRLMNPQQRRTPRNLLSLRKYLLSNAATYYMCLLGIVKGV